MREDRNGFPVYTIVNWNSSWKGWKIEENVCMLCERGWKFEEKENFLGECEKVFAGQGKYDIMSIACP